MRILIVEDEPATARQLQRELEKLLGNQLQRVAQMGNLVSASCYLREHEIDLLFLDLDLEGEDGFDLLHEVTAGSYQTIILSAKTERAIEAFHLGVLDFIPKPADTERLRMALARFEAHNSRRESLKFISVSEDGVSRLIPLGDILYLEAELKHSVIALLSGEKIVCRRSLKQLGRLLPDTFVRTHKSYIVRREHMGEIRKKTGSAFEVTLMKKIILPVARSFVRKINNLS